MEYFFRFEYWWLLSITIPLVLFGVLCRHWLGRTVYFRYALAHELKEKRYASRHPHQKIFYTIQLIVFIILALLVAKPQLVDSHSNIVVEGIDIMLVVDASGSMSSYDCSDNQSRFEIAKKEAIRFVQKRINDAIGLVLFGRDAISRCPLTMDKKTVNEIADGLKIGDVDPDGTMLGTSLITAINRLKHSEAASKIIILLTDGAPSPGDINPDVATEIAKKFGIKIYTIGIGGDQDEFFMDPRGGFGVKPKVNRPLLQKIARNTGGKFFMAYNARDMRSIYDTIDQLEKTKHTAPLYSHYIDIFAPFILLVILLLGMQQLLSTFVWFSL